MVTVKGFSASKTRSNRPGWSVIFRHPKRTDGKGKPGLKIRKGLGTDDDAKADELVSQLNSLLSDDSWWAADRRKEAESKFASVVVSAFFDGIESGDSNSFETREAKLPLPTKKDGYSQILFLGTTGAGKTTLLRHVIGTDGNSDRFPSTSTAKTTTADLEIIAADDDTFSSAVTFMPEHEVRAHIEECLEDACLEFVQTQSESKAISALLQHKEQRFRLSYILGSWSETLQSDNADFEFEDDSFADVPWLDEEEKVSATEQLENKSKLDDYLRRLKKIVADTELVVAGSIGALRQQKNADDRAVWLELFGHEVFNASDFSNLVLDILDDISARFGFVEKGALVRGQNEWPNLWSFETSDRDEFLAQVRWFSSNHHAQFGRLLTPLVDGLRVRGRFAANLDDTLPQKLVLLDGEGIGHTASSAASISTRITKRFETVDMILLVDNAQQPIQAGPLALLRTVGSGGFANKLAVAFTHFDQVKGANLSSFDQKKEHVIASIRNAVASLRDTVGGGVAGALDRQLDRKSFFLGGLNKETQRLPPGIQKEFSRLLQGMEDAAKTRNEFGCVPIYQFKGLEIAMRDAIDAFRNPWEARLGLGYHDGIPREHWARIKALSRRLANGWGDEYDNLTPIADLLSSLQQEASKWLDRPADWKPLPANDEEREAALNTIRQAVFSRLFEIVTKRLKNEQVANWRVAYSYAGAGSGSERARQIDNINEHAAPRMTAAMSSDARDFLQTLYIVLQDAIFEAGGEIQPVVTQ